MQNRNMFPFRRQGPKKRNKSNNARKGRGPQRALPNSARDMSTALQQATKSLAQMLAGRSNPSGQLANAQSVLGHAERLISERQHNRLNPGEREEFFEQLARLRLTIADAEAEAEVNAAEEEMPRRQAPPIDQERLRAMALALSQPEPEPERLNGHGEAEQAADLAPAADEPAEPEVVADPVAVSAANAKSGRLQLSRSGHERAADALAEPIGPARPRRLRTRPAAPRPAAPPASESEGSNGTGQRHEVSGAEAPVPDPVVEPPVSAGPAEEQATAQTTKRRRSAKSKTGLPEGWVIDDEGFVVPGPR